MLFLMKVKVWSGARTGSSKEDLVKATSEDDPGSSWQTKVRRDFVGRRVCWSNHSMTISQPL